jgi:hypothetical protein
MAQGFANHVTANAEELRPRLVKHSEKVVIVVRRDDFFKGSRENPWTEVFEKFTDQIREHIGEATHDLLLPDFSTTGVVERAAAQVSSSTPCSRTSPMNSTPGVGFPKSSWMGPPTTGKSWPSERGASTALA